MKTLTEKLAELSELAKSKIDAWYNHDGDPKELDLYFHHNGKSYHSITIKDGEYWLLWADLQSMKDYVAKRLDDAEKSMQDKINSLIEAQKKLVHIRTLKPLVDSQPTFQDAVDFLIKYEK